MIRDTPYSSITIIHSYLAAGQSYVLWVMSHKTHKTLTITGNKTLKITIIPVSVQEQYLTHFPKFLQCDVMGMRTNFKCLLYGFSKAVTVTELIM